jgi:hypothetical protein
MLEAFSTKGIRMNLHKRSFSGAIKLLSTSFIIMSAASTSPAATTPRILTVTLIQGGTSGIVVVDQRTGTIDSCTATFAVRPGLEGQCLKIGHASPTSALPIPSDGLSVFTQLAYEDGGNTAQLDWFWIVNNQTGAITVCIAGSSAAKCTELGVAPE